MSDRSAARGKGLSREVLVRAALEIVDREGLSALSMRRLGTKLGVDPMAAYRHFPNKEALLDGVVEAVVSEVDLEVDETLPWQQQVRRLVESDIAAISAHPNALPLLATRPLTTPGSLRLVEKALSIMHSAGIPLMDAAVAINMTGLLTVGLATAAAASRQDVRSSEDLRKSFGSLPRDSFPLIVEAVETGQLIESYEEILDFALGAIIGRLERLAV